MDSILGALIAKIKTAPFYGEFAGGVWALELDDSVGQKYPAGLLRYPKTRFQWTSETTRIEKPQIELFVYGQVAEKVESLARRSWEFWLDAEMPVFSGRMMQIYPTDFAVEAVQARDQDALRRFQAIVPMEVWFSK